MKRYGKDVSDLHRDLASEDAFREAIIGLPERRDDDESFLTAEEWIRRDPGLLDAPVEIVPYLAFAGRLVMISAVDKIGKSTLLAHAGVSVTLGRPFLGTPVVRGHVVWLRVEEHPADVIERHQRLGGDLDRLHVLKTADARLLDRLHERLAYIRERWFGEPIWIVLDGLTAYENLLAAGRPAHQNDAGEASAVARPLARVVQESGAGLTIAHHQDKSGQRYRGSSEYGAAMDVRYEMNKLTEAEDPVQLARRLVGEGRRSLAHVFTVRLFDPNTPTERYELASSDAPDLGTLIWQLIERNPGISRTDVRKRVGRGSNTVSDVINEHIKAGLVREQKPRGGLHPVYRDAPDDLDPAIVERAQRYAQTPEQETVR